MAIVNRDLDVTQQIQMGEVAVSTAVGASAGAGFHVYQAPFPGVLRAVTVAANSVSGSPVVAVDVKRFTSGGVTTIAYVGSTMTVYAYGLSAAYQSISLSAPGSTLLMLQAGDVVVLNQLFSGGNVAVGGAIVSVAIQASQDYVQHFNVTS